MACLWKYVFSPSVVNGDARVKQETAKRHVEVIDSTEPSLSRKKLKKLRRYAGKSFVPKADKFVKCGTCENPKVCLII